LSVVSLSDDQTFHAWSRAPRPDPVSRIAELGVTATSMTLAPDASTLAVGLTDGTVRLLDPVDGRERSRLTGGGGAIDAVAFLGPDRLVTGDETGALRVWDVANGARIGGQDAAHHGAITSIAVFGTDSHVRLITAGTDGWLRLWSAALGAPTAQVDTRASLTDVAADASGIVVAVGRIGEVIRWNPPAATTERIASVGKTVWAVALDEHSAVLARDGAVVSMWALGDRRGATLSWEQGAQTGGALDVTYLDADGLAIGSHDGRLRFSDARTGTAIGPPLALGGAPIRQVVAGPDSTVWAVDSNGAVYRCDALVLHAGDELPKG
jgi:WD40 repeat protein